ncbi:hypothetical protein PCANC_20625 [Puccinia coronata f. sp. avenae]|uniref:DNA 3'-5' helicase n=1 Tax=Puccinia coronata f. sp. avenae TaxID=200324 RepID=A0A2N5SIX9_9BASI|nr:hypothetical protein PCANC_20625 [Puccinia coronata f. sp. avenae]
MLSCLNPNRLIEWICGCRYCPQTDAAALPFTEISTELFFSKDFQNRLGLIAVDEAHMIYIWGLVSSCKGSKTFAVHVRHANSGVFRPSYGNLGAHLLFRNNKPILLLSATCRPVAVAAISQSLKLDEDSLDILQGELTRPEIRII